MLHAPVVIAADYAGTFEVGGTSELRGRFTAQAGQGQTGLDVFVEPHARLNVVNRDGWTFVLGNAPFVTWNDMENGLCTNCVTVYDTGNASIAWHDHSLNVTLSEDASGGAFNTVGGPFPQTTPMAGTMPTTGQPAQTPPQQVVPNASTLVWSASTRTALSMQAQVNRVASLTLGASYLTNGGIDAPSRKIFPEQYGPRADASFSYTLSRQDQLVTLAYAFATQFTAGQCYDFATGTFVIGMMQCTPAAQLALVSEGIRHALDRETTLSVDAGISWARSRSTDSVPFQESLYPNGDVELRRSLGMHGASSVLVGAAIFPVLDWRTAVVNERLQGHVTLSEALTKLVAFHANIDVSQTIPTDAPLAATVVGGLAEVSYQSTRQLVFASGVRAWWQQQDPFGSFSSYMIYFDVTVSPPALRF